MDSRSSFVLVPVPVLVLVHKLARLPLQLPLESAQKLSLALWKSMSIPWSVLPTCAMLADPWC